MLARALLYTVTILAFCSRLSAADNLLDTWKHDVNVHPLLPSLQAHSIHTYYVTSPESPDGKQILVYTSTDGAGHKGSIVTVDRATGTLTTLAENVVTEDAHRVACQQWVCGGRGIVFHDLRNGEWAVC